MYEIAIFIRFTLSYIHTTLGR